MADKGEICKNRKYFTPYDLIIFSVVVIAAVWGFFGLLSKGGDDELVAVIQVGGNTVEEILLSDVKEEYSLTVKGYDSSDVVLLITSESVEFTHSPCSDKLCINTGKLTKSGESAVCLPQRVSVKLQEAEGIMHIGQPDAVVG